jgi:hypothetical protein
MNDEEFSWEKCAKEEEADEKRQLLLQLAILKYLEKIKAHTCPVSSDPLH